MYGSIIILVHILIPVSPQCSCRAILGNTDTESVMQWVFFFFIYSLYTYIPVYLTKQMFTLLNRLTSRRLFENPYSFIEQSTPWHISVVKRRFSEESLANKWPPSGNGLLPFSEPLGRGQVGAKIKGFLSHLPRSGKASVLKSVQSNLKLISLFGFLLLLFLAREKITSVFFFRRVRKRNIILFLEIAYRISKSDLFPDVAKTYTGNGSM